MEKSSPDKPKSSPDSSTRQPPPGLALRIHDSSDLRRVFQKYDSNGDGKISLSELESMLQSLGSSSTAEEARVMMEAAVMDGDGFISLDEFLSVNVAETDSRKCMEELRSAFEVFDRDMDGLISAKELQRVLQSMGEEASMAACQSMIGSVDQSGSGSVDFDEFLGMMTRSSRRPFES